MLLSKATYRGGSTIRLDRGALERRPVVRKETEEDRVEDRGVPGQEESPRPPCR